LLSTCQSKPSDFAACLPQILGDGVPVDVHRTDVSVTHEFLLHSYRRADRIQPRSVGVAEYMTADMADACFRGGIAQQTNV